MYVYNAFICTGYTVHVCVYMSVYSIFYMYNFTCFLILILIGFSCIFMSKCLGGKSLKDDLQLSELEFIDGNRLYFKDLGKNIKGLQLYAFLMIILLARMS